MRSSQNSWKRLKDMIYIIYKSIIDNMQYLISSNTKKVIRCRQAVTELKSCHEEVAGGEFSKRGQQIKFRNNFRRIF
ncbi:hypothetical protein MTBBW1_1300011 [Desulfamplus magnetovallimortis]|uniref:Uncharacterized protein n=1 Tax=Desulfamplus magnetovallimortis TaxID=1246637 RepID=A0A1W1H719_9BACT|nr:hypothetical protein MTBBW1_1300011 [Desulfamplus magnetovallimortis]